MKHDITLGDLSQWNWNLWNILESVKLVLREVATNKTSKLAWLLRSCPMVTYLSSVPALSLKMDVLRSISQCF